MKILVNEEVGKKMYGLFQRLIDETLSEVKERYRSEEITASNWYLSTISKVDKVVVNMVKLKPALSVYFDVYSNNPSFDEDDVQTFGNYLREKLYYAGNPWMVPTLINNKLEDEGMITENKVDKLKYLLNREGASTTIKLMGGWDRFCKIFNLSGPMDFLHLFDDLEAVQSEDKFDYILFRYQEGNNLMVYDKRLKCLYISDDEIWDFLNKYLGIEYYSIIEYTKKWAEDVFHLNPKRTEPLMASTYIKMI